MIDENTKFAVDIISNELLGDTNETRQHFLHHFSAELENFISIMAATYLHWKIFDKTIKGSTGRAHISALLYGAINAHVVSLKLLINGYLIPSGNLQRQVLESVSMALLCSKQELGFIERYIDQKYSTNKAVRDLIKNHKKLGLNRSSLETLKKSRNFYDNFSHPTFMTIGANIGYSSPELLFFGSVFDEGKMPFYKKEIKSKVSFAKIINNIIDGIQNNLDNKF